jgi:hypothetical protein
VKKRQDRTADQGESDKHRTGDRNGPPSETSPLGSMHATRQHAEDGCRLDRSNSDEQRDECGQQRGVDR